MINYAENLDYRFGDYGGELIEQVSSKLGNSFTPKYNKSGVTFYGTNGRILKLVNRSTMLEVEFNVPVTKVLGVSVLTDNEAIDKHMGTCRWIYRGDSLFTILELVEEAKDNYNLYG